MPLDFRILKDCGTTDERLREILTATAPVNGDTEELKAKKEADAKIRQRFEELFQSRIQEGIDQSLASYHLYSASDLAWDSTPINKATIPLMLYAQNRLTTEECANLLTQVGCDRFVKKDSEGNKVVNRPKFVVVEVNLIRSVITRRLAAQMNRFNNLWPQFKYDARSTRPEAKLRADALSQRIDMACDQFGLRRMQEQVCRDIMLYAHATIFPRSRWQRDVEWYKDDTAPEFGTDGKRKWKARVKREGVAFELPHPSRVFYDAAYPMSSINDDTGCEWFGYWDVTRWSQIKDSPDFFNREAISYNADQTQYSLSNRAYFTQYYSTVMSNGVGFGSPSEGNDRTSKVGAYAGIAKDAPVFLTHKMMKLTPVEYGVGTYPYPVWVHFTIAGDCGTVVHAEIMPDTPGIHFSFNESHHRTQNLSIAHDLMGHQDQMTNLHTLLLEEVNRDLFTVFALNTDLWEHSEDAKLAREEFLAAIAAGQYDKPLMICGSFGKIRHLLGENAVTADNILKVIRTTPNTALENIFKAMAQEMSLAERMIALSPQEQGQMSPRETSATEVQIVATTTENVYSFISDALDAGRAAWKRYLYNAFVSCATDDIYIPVAERYSEAVAKRAGFKLQPNSAEPMDPQRSYQGGVLGSKWSLVEEYIFNSRDGAERASNVQAAQALTQLLQVVLSTPAAAAITKGKFGEMLNEIARLGGSGVDLNLNFSEEEQTQSLMPPGPVAPQPAAPPAAQPAPTLAFA